MVNGKALFPEVQRVSPGPAQPVCSWLGRGFGRYGVRVTLGSGNETGQGWCGRAVPYPSKGQLPLALAHHVPNVDTSTDFVR